MSSRLAKVLEGEHIDIIGTGDSNPEFDASSNDGDANGSSDGNHQLNRGKGTEISGMCIECEDQPASLFCMQCTDDFCDVCYQSVHRKGSRRKHMAKFLNGNVGSEPQNPTTGTQKPEMSDKMETDEDSEVMTAEEINQLSQSKLSLEYESHLSFGERAKFIPLRLSLKERKSLRLLESALTVSEYTDKIDILSYRSNKSQRMVAQIKDLCAILCGLVVAADYQVGQELIQDKDYKFNEAFFRRVFEIGRRHKIMNPEKMRSTYGKLIYLLMDSMLPQVEEMLEFSCVSEVKTVFSYLQQRECLKLLDDPLMHVATSEIIPDEKPRRVIEKEIRQKEKAIESLARKYRSKIISDDDIRTCLYSIGDNNSFLRGNRDPIDYMIYLLKKHFSPNKSQPPLAISSGKNGARLSHSHERQYYYVLQSMTLWREISHHMFKLWYLADLDMLDSESGYKLRDTGQGLNRVQYCPRVAREIHRILADVMRQVGSGNWVGSSVIHLGDTNVPNALMFIDKYTQVPRILTPIVSCIQKIDSYLAKDPKIVAYINATFGSIEQLKNEILSDFFRYGFDGSGADNFFDAGSCIDGRLTSAWNWCQKIEKKRYFNVFLMCGFIGFDGEF